MIRNSLERYIPSKEARELIANGEYNYSDSDVAAIIWHSDLPLIDKHEQLEKLAEQTNDNNLRQQIFERVCYDRQSLEVFENNRDGFVYVVTYSEGIDNQGCLGYFGNFELAVSSAIDEGFDFKISKYQIIDKDTKLMKRRAVCAEFMLKEGETVIEELDAGLDVPIAEYELNGSGKIMYYWSNELPINELVRKVETLSNTRFENKYVVMPNPFDEGDIVRDIYTGRTMVVETSQKQWSECIKRTLRPNAIEDWSDASITVVYGEAEEKCHSHINPIWLERLEYCT